MQTNPLLFLCATVITAPILAGCHIAGINETVLPVRVDYQCANNRVLQVKRVPEKNSAITIIDGKTVLLPHSDSAAQEKYSNGRYTLYLQGERAMLEENGQVLFSRCSAGPLPTIKRDGFSRE